MYRIYNNINHVFIKDCADKESVLEFIKDTAKVYNKGNYEEHYIDNFRTLYFCGLELIVEELDSYIDFTN